MLAVFLWFDACDVGRGVRYYKEDSRSALEANGRLAGPKVGVQCP